jgi:hypothetical protein
MPLVGFELTISAFERAKTVHAFDRAATVIGQVLITAIKMFIAVDFSVSMKLFGVEAILYNPQNFGSLSVPLHRVHISVIFISRTTE